MAYPVLLNSCAFAATAVEAGFRIDYPLVPSKATRLVALDAVANDVVRRVTASDWHNTRLYSLEEDMSTGYTIPNGNPAAVTGLEDVDVVILVAGTDAGSDGAATIGEACFELGVMTVGLVVTRPPSAARVVAALRPFARILVHPADLDDLQELLRALRA